MNKTYFISFIIFFLTHSVTTPAETRSCESLADLEIADTQISAATTVDPSPEWPLPDSLFTAVPWETQKSVSVPFCRVEAVLEKEIAFEVWLPDDWNGKYMGVGNGGFMGAIHYPDLTRAIMRSYAAASTNTGHDSVHVFDSDWMTGNPDRIPNFGHRAHHLLAVTSKKIIQAYYGSTPAYSYFKGCSMGGMEGLTAAQKYPDDYIGIIAGAPANNLTRLQLRGIWEAQLNRNNPEGVLSEEQKQLIAAAAVNSCDAKDGVEDGLISDPVHCSFDPAELLCRNTDSGVCLTQAQVETARSSYGRVYSPGGLALYPGPAPGTTLVRLPHAPENNVDDLGLFKLLPQWEGRDVLTFDYDRDLPPIEKELDPVFNAVDPDLSAFRDRGGKLLMYHGWLDNGISPYNTLDYINKVNEEMGPENMNDFLRLFTVPGMEHCRGGPGPNQFDMVTPLEQWVEQGKAPERITAVHRTDGRVDRSRPLCVFPQRAHYKGQGNPDLAENFVCK